MARAKDWRYFKKDDKLYARETNTMPQWAVSCWYYFRFLDPNNDEMAFSPELDEDWMPVDLYVGGAEHAVLHLLYARFWHQVLYDLGITKHPEPFQKLVHQGMILGSDGEKVCNNEHLQVETCNLHSKCTVLLKYVLICILSSSFFAYLDVKISLKCN